jgi:gas vesicle protein
MWKGITMNDRIYYSRQAEMQANREKTITVILFLAFGIGIGALMALLFAPKSGDKMRKELADTIEERFNTVEKEITRLGKQAEERLKDIRQ